MPPEETRHAAILARARSGVDTLPPEVLADMPAAVHTSPTRAADYAAGWATGGGLMLAGLRDLARAILDIEGES